jgi:membrane-bound ClpP family serine protease
MTWIILLFVLGLLFIAVEVIIPGGILGAIGGLMMFGGCFMAFAEFGTAGGLVAVVAALGLAIFTIYFEFKILPKTTIGRRAFLTKEVTGVSAAFGDEARALIGKPAEALTMLSPSGYVDIDGKRYEAFCQSGQAPAGTPLQVIGADNFRLIVSPTKPN